MSRINKIKTVLDSKDLKGYQITEVTDNSYEQFYVKGKLETQRRIIDTVDNVVVYVENTVNDKKTLGQADFKVTREMSKKEISNLAEFAISNAKYINNEPFELVKDSPKKSYSYKANKETPLEILEKAAKIFFDNETDNFKFNSLECFFKENTVTFTNSFGVMLKKKTFCIKIEAIPSYYSENFKTELYRMFTYDTVDYAKIEKDVKQSLSDLVMRGNAEKVSNVQKTNVILRAEQIRELFDEIISTYSYPSVYNHSNLKQVGDDIQSSPYEKINLSLTYNTKADFFDSDGIILDKCQIIKDGKLISYFGSNRFAQYLGMKPTGNLPKIVLSTGNNSVAKLKKQPYIEIIDLSGIQVDAFAGYLGGEVRLADYYDGKKHTPISGFSFSVNLDDAINHMYFSKEKETINNYEGPSIIKIENVDIV